MRDSEAQVSKSEGKGRKDRVRGSEERIVKTASSKVGKEEQEQTDDASEGERRTGHSFALLMWKGERRGGERFLTHNVVGIKNVSRWRV